MRTNNQPGLATEAERGANRYGIRTTRPGSGRWRDRSASRCATVFVLLSVAILMATSACSAGSGNILGPWKTDGGDSLLELFACGEKICGKIVWLKVPNYIDRSDGPIGETKVDRKNPDPALRNRPILGLRVMSGFTDKGNNRWENGTCYDPESGKSYTCKMHLVSPHVLELRGYIGFSFFGRTFRLTR